MSSVRAARCLESRRTRTRVLGCPLLSLCQVAGYNYAQWAYDRDHERVPERVIVATETFPVRSVEEFQMAEVRRPEA